VEREVERRRREAESKCQLARGLRITSLLGKAKLSGKRGARTSRIPNLSQISEISTTTEKFPEEKSIQKEFQGERETKNAREARSQEREERNPAQFE